MVRGQLRVYLGAAPGVGKTYAMLDEGWRRHERGTDVVVGFVEAHGRPKTVAQLRDLEIVPRRRVEYRGSHFEEMDLDAVLARRPKVALVDEMAHTNVPGSRNEKRWQDIEALLAAGIDVISTVNIQHLDSLNDVVERIAGVVQRETVPDDVVRRADQIELVDMSPEALRRRMAHGNIYPPERVDAALANYFRPGNLAALRELALLWLADQVETGLQSYMDAHGIAEAWETRERVVVAITGRPGGDHLVRRASRMAARQHGELIGVHVVASDGLTTRSGEHLDEQRRLVGQLKGSYSEVVSDDVAAGLVGFARAEKATQLVLGATRHGRLQELVRGSIAGRVLRQAEGIDVHVISAHEDEASAELAVRPPPRSRDWVRRAAPLPLKRRLVGLVVAVIGLPALTAVLAAAATPCRWPPTCCCSWPWPCSSRPSAASCSVRSRPSPPRSWRTGSWWNQSARSRSPHPRTRWRSACSWQCRSRSASTSTAAPPARGRRCEPAPKRRSWPGRRRRCWGSPTRSSSSSTRSAPPSRSARSPC